MRHTWQDKHTQTHTPHKDRVPLQLSPTSTEYGAQASGCSCTSRCVLNNCRALLWRACVPLSLFACAQCFYFKKRKSMNERTCAHEYDMRATEGGKASARARTHCLNVCVNFSPGGRGSSVCAIRQRKWRPGAGSVKSEELVGEPIRVSKPAFLPL